MRLITTCRGAAHTSRLAFLALFLTAAVPRTTWTAPTAEASQQSSQAQLPIPKMAGTNIVFGTVIADASGRPVKGASVNVIVFSSAATFSRSVTTDRQGRFVIGGLEAAQVRLSASAPGYLSAIAGQNGPDDTSGTNIPLQDGLPVGPLVLRLVKSGVITGTIVDEAIEPMGGVAVQAFKRTFANGVRQFAAAETARTDDRGVYRITGLTPGTYVVGVVPRIVVLDNATLERVAESGSVGMEGLSVMSGMSLVVDQDAASAGTGPLMVGGSVATHVFSAGSPAQMVAGGVTLGYGPTFFPGTPPATAQSIRVGAAEEKTADFQMADVPLATFVGRVVEPDGTPPPQTALALVRQGDASVLIGDTLTALVGDSGEFGFDYVPAGAYRLEARSTGLATSNTPGATTDRLWASVPISVDEKPHAPVVISLHAGVRVSGDVRFDGATAQPAAAILPQWRVSLTSADPAPALARMSGVNWATLDSDGHFAFGPALMPGDYKVQVGTGLPGPWSLESSTTGGVASVDGILHVGGDDIEHATIVMTDRPTMVSGAVTSADGKPVTDVTVIAFPHNPQLWLPNTRRIVSARPSSDGRYQVKELPPGDYAIAVVRVVERGQWFDPAFLAGLQAGAERVTVGAGETRTLDLKIR